MDISWIISIVLCLIIIYLFYMIVKKKESYWERMGVPHVKDKILFGNSWNILLGKKSLVEIITDVYREFTEKKFAGVTVFGTPMLVVRDIELLNNILIKDFTFFQDRVFPLDEKHDITNAGLQNISGDKWRVLRHKLTPTFTSGKMKMMFHDIKKCSDEVVQHLKNKTNEDLDIRDLLFRFVLNVIGRVSFGINADSLNKETEKTNAFYQNSKEFFKPSMFFQLKFFIASTAPKLKNILGIKLVDEYVNNYFPKLTKDLIKLREGNNERRNDFLQLMLEQKKKESEYILNNLNQLEDDTILTEEILKDAEPEDLELVEHLKNMKFDKNATVFTDEIITAQSFTFISGGSETVTSVLTFASCELALDKDVQKRLQQEIDEIVESNGFTYDAIRKMKYLDQVLNEVIRLWPPGGILQRICTQEYKIPGTDLVVPKGQIILVPVKGIHRDPQYFYEPEKFDPDHFQDMDSIEKGVFMPFGSGPRFCIAMRLAMLEMKIFLATLLKSYNLVISKKTRLPLKLSKRMLIQQAIGGVWVQVEPRK